MATERQAYAGSNLPSIIIDHQAHHQAPSESSFYLSGSSPLYPGSSNMLNFKDMNNNNNSSKNKRSFFQSFELEDNGDDQDYDEYFNQSGKKRRLALDQLNFLEKSFEMDNKLEPDRKLQLAKDLGLQPRQVAIWFQNRRARWKTKQMEKDYDVLKESFDMLRVNYDTLFQEKEQLKSQIALLSAELALKQKCKKVFETLEPCPMQENPAAASISDSEESKVSAIASKQEEYSTSPKMDNVIFDSYSISTKEDNVFDIDSHYYIDGGNIHSPHLEHVDSSYMLEPDNSDISQDEDDRSFLPSTPCRLLPKLEPRDYSLASSSTSGHFAYPFEDDAFWSWSF